MNNLSIVLKTVERCNLNCSYCYFFNGGDKTYLKRPKFISKSTIDSLANFLEQGTQDNNIEYVSIVLHGGEPLMQPKEDFVYMIQKLQDSLETVKLSFSIQTNATLVTKKWIDLFNKYNIGVGVSIDGPPEYNDKYRIDHYGNGSYDQIVRGIKLLQDELNTSFGSLTVINPDFSGSRIYRHLVDLGFKTLDFLLPDNNHSTNEKYDNVKITKFLLEVFNEWINDNNEEISIRKFRTMILQLLGEAPLLYGFGKSNENDIPILSIRSDGEITPSDELTSTNTKLILTGKYISNTSLSEILKNKIFSEIKEAAIHAPDKCAKCCWYNACGGGILVSRYSKENGFNNPSIYCDTYKKLFANVASYLIKSGVQKDIITNNLLHTLLPAHL